MNTQKTESLTPVMPEADLTFLGLGPVGHGSKLFKPEQVAAHHAAWEAHCAALEARLREVEGKVAGWQYRDCHAWDTKKPSAWSRWRECDPRLLEQIRENPQFDGLMHEVRPFYVSPPTPQQPEAGDPYERGLQTPRRMKAVESLLAAGWKWDGANWQQPEAQAGVEGMVECQMEWTPVDMHHKKWTCRNCGRTHIRNSSDGHPYFRCAAPQPEDASS